MQLYQEIATRLCAMRHCEKSNNEQWRVTHLEVLKKLEKSLPSGGGFDCGSGINLTESNENKIVIETSFHHMNETGYYDGWTSHKIIVTPSLLHGFDLRITGKDKNKIKECIHDSFFTALTERV